MRPRYIARLILGLITLFVCLMMASCGTMRSVSKDVHTKDSQSHVRKVVTEKADTVIHLPAKRDSASKPIESIQAGDSLVIDNPSMRVVVIYDPTSGHLNATGATKPKDVLIQIDRTTVTETDTRVRVDDRTKDVQSKPAWGFPWWIFAVIILLVFFALRLRR